MLQRSSLEFGRMLRLRQRILSSHASHRFFSNVLIGEHVCRRVLLQSKFNSRLCFLLYKQRFATKEPKILVSPVKPSTDSSSGRSSRSDAETAKETIKRISVKPNISAEADAPPKTITAADINSAAKTTEVQQHPAPPPTITQTKNFEIQTSKGVLSITTTIEDSKINDVILEKTSTVPEPVIPNAPVVDKMALDNTSKMVPSASSLPSEISNENHISNESLASSVASPAATNLDIPQEQIPPPEVKPKKQRPKVDFNRSSLERNFVTPARAMGDFLLKASDLESLPKIKRRSPYEQEPPITVYWRKDVEAKAIEVWGSRENLLNESLKRELERKKHQQNIFTVKRRLRDYRREIGSRTVIHQEEKGLRGKSGKVVVIAVAINGVNFLFKLFGWLYSGSHSMFSEMIHSLADCINQLILAYGIHKSTQMADPDHPYGYTNMKYVSSLISGVGIFCVGAGLSVYHGITGLISGEPMPDLFWAFFILGGSLVSEGATLLVAVNQLRHSAKAQNMSFKDYVLSGKDPCVNVVLTEDAAAVASVFVAVACMGLSTYTGSPIFDAVGSLLVGSILGGVASFIIYTNVAALVGRSILPDHIDKINAELESDLMIRAIHDVKGIDIGNSLVRYKAELDFDGRELTRFYLDKLDLQELLKVVKSFQTVEELEEFLLAHGENIVDLMGGEIDRIEMKLRKKFPEIRHCDLEIL